MRSSRAIGFAATLLLGAISCKGEIHDLGGKPDPILTLHLRLTDPLPQSLVHPRAGILWAGVPSYIPYCQDHGPNPRDPTRKVSGIAERACRDPFEVVPFLSGPSTAIGLDSGDIDVPILQLPPASALIGTLSSRIAYGSIVIYDDSNGDGQLTLSRCGVGGEDRGGPMLSTDTASTATVGSKLFEPIYAASFTTLTADQVRLAYLEGPFDKASFYYPSPSCEVVPPSGFSIWKVGNLLDPSATCSLAPIDQVIELHPTPYDDDPFFPAFRELTDLACVDRARDAYPHEPPMRLPGGANIFECADETLIVTNYACICPNRRIYTLKGCDTAYDCPANDWNVPPPPYWPCKTSTASGS